MSKVALVTGARQGIGRAISFALAQQGFDVAINCRNEQTALAAREVANECMKHGVDADCFTADVSQFEECAEMVKRVMARWGRIDVLVNNAGYENIQPFTEVTAQVYDDIMNVNLKGVFFTAQEVAKVMKRTGGGKIINIGSLGSYIGLAESSVYCATKGGVIQLSKTMAIELGEFNIQVNCLAPGYFSTPMTQPFYDDPKHRAWIESRIPLHQWGTTLDLAGPVLFLASAASNYVTGETIKVDGGWLAS